MITIKANLYHDQGQSLLDSSQYLDYNQGGMIREFTCYKCQCEKCGHSWATKSYDVPRVCAKCHSVKWNDDGKVETVITPKESPLNAPIRESIPQVKQIEQSEPEPPIEQIDWSGWTGEQQTYDDQTGDMRTFRKHIKSGRVKWIDAESWIG